jgi:hypothetical protein
MRFSTTTVKEDLAWLLAKKGTFSDSSLTRSRKPDAYNSVDCPQIALLAPRTHAAQPYNERKVIFTNNPAYVTVKRGEGWEAMLKRHYDERVVLDKGPVHKDNSWVRKIVNPIYAAIRRQRRKY